MYLKEEILKGDNLIKVLSYFGYENITERGDEIRCSYGIDTNPSSIKIKKNEILGAVDFSRDVKGDIFTLIMENRKKTFQEVVAEINSLLGIKYHYVKEDKSGSIARILDDLELKKKKEIQYYEDVYLQCYKDVWNKRFLEDGISIKTQKKFEVMYDEESERIVIPHRSIEGKLLGVVGRTNISGEDKPLNKYICLLPFSKTVSLYGILQNYKHLFKAKRIYVGESEKFVMQLDTMNINNAVSLGGSNISKEQMVLLLKLHPEEIVFCFDEGLDIFKVYNQINRFKMFSMKTGIKVGLMIDKNNKFLKEKSKSSPSDHGIEIWDAMVESCIEWF